MRISKVGALASVAVLTFAACGTGGTASNAPSASAPGASGSPAGGGDTSKGTVKIAIELPLQGSELAAAQPIINLSLIHI